MNFNALSSQFLFSIIVTRKFGRSKFERSLILKFEMLPILKFDCLKFQPSPERPVFRNFKIANIKIKEDELFDNFIFELFFSFFRNYLNNQNI